MPYSSFFASNQPCTLVMAAYFNHTALNISDSSLISISEPVVVSTSKFRITPNGVIKESDTVITIEDNDSASSGVKTTSEILQWFRSKLEKMNGTKKYVTFLDLERTINDDIQVSVTVVHYCFYVFAIVMLLPINYYINL